MALVGTQTRPGRSYRDFRPVVLPVSLDELKASHTGEVTVPHRMNWSPKSSFSMANDDDVARLYVTVIQEASTPEDFVAYLDRATLVRLWPTLNVGPRLAELWAARFPELPTRTI